MDLFSGSKLEKEILRITHKFQITGFAFPFLKIPKNNIYLLQVQYLDLGVIFVFSRVAQARLN